MINMRTLYLLFLFVTYTYSLSCFECFLSLDQNGDSKPNFDLLKNCTRENKCTTASACIINKNLRKHQFFAYCLHSEITPRLKYAASNNRSRDNEGTKGNGCWKAPDNGDEEFCYCTSDFCNEISPIRNEADQKFNVLTANPFISREEDEEIESVTEKNLLELAHNNSNAITEDKDLTPVKFEDYDNQASKSEKDDDSNRTTKLDNNSGLICLLQPITLFIAFLSAVLSSLLL